MRFQPNEPGYFFSGLDRHGLCQGLMACVCICVCLLEHVTIHPLQYDSCHFPVAAGQST